MKTIYLDPDYLCHANNDGTMQEVQTDVFDNLCAGALECYRYIPAGQAWTRPDGRVLHGPFIQPCKPTEVIDGIQRQYETDETQRWGGLGIPQEHGMIATRNYPAESFLAVQGQLYETIRSIPVYTSINSSNVVKTTIEHYLESIKEE